MTNNTFVNAAASVANMTTAENGHPVASTTGSALLDLYGQIGALRGQDEGRIIKLFERALAEDKLLAMKILFYGRDARGGTGEREVFRTLAKWCAMNHPELLQPNVKLFPEYGRWDDLYSLVDTPLEKEAFDNVVGEQLGKDLANHVIGKPVSLMGKWLKSPNASSKETCRLGKLTAKYLCFDERGYRHLLKLLRDDIRIVESQMSRGEWNEIQYDKLPSKAGMIYRDAFKKHDEERYSEYVQSVLKGEKKMNAAMNTPQDLVHCYVGRNMSKWYNAKEDPTVEAMWKSLPDFVKSDENVLCMVDVSGSMYGRPIEVSTGLGIYFAQHNTGAFHNLYMTFESTPKFHQVHDDQSFLDNLRDVLCDDWGGSTNLNLACEEMLKFAVRNHVPQKDMPTRLVIISDMEIDRAVRVYNRYSMLRSNADCLSDILHVDELGQMYANAGYKMPQVIYWNVESRDNHFHTRSDVPGTMLASGSSPRVFEAVMAMKDLDITPYDAMLEVLNGERYSPVTIG